MLDKLWFPDRESEKSSEAGVIFLPAFPCLPNSSIQSFCWLQLAVVLAVSAETSTSLLKTQEVIEALQMFGW